VYDLFILGQLMDHSMTGYALRKAFSSVVGNEMTISFGSLYPLLDKLAKSGEITLTFEETDNKRPQKVATITKIGQDRFMELALEEVPVNKQTQLTFQMKLNFLHLLNQTQQVKVLKDFQASTLDHLKKLEELRLFLKNNHHMIQADIDDALLLKELQIARTKTQYDWVTALLKRVIKGD